MVCKMRAIESDITTSQAMLEKFDIKWCVKPACFIAVVCRWLMRWK